MATEKDYPRAHRTGGSTIGKAIRTEANKELPKISNDNLPCPNKTGCCWFATGLEDLFRSMIANWFAGLAKDRLNLAFNDVIYHPATRSEGVDKKYKSKGGFDLSLGALTRTDRARIALKHLPGRWVDRPWTYTPTGKSLGKLSGHIKTILTAYHEQTALEKAHPYLGIVVCYCLHEYRHMGRRVNGVHIPGLTDTSRLTLVDLLPIASTPLALEAVNWTAFSLSIECDGNEKVTPTWWVKPDEKQGLSKVTLKAIADSVFPVAQGEQ